jgi:hypothetical protein
MMSEENQNVPWNKGKLLGQKRLLKHKEIWGIRIRLELAGLTICVLSRLTSRLDV